MSKPKIQLNELYYSKKSNKRLTLSPKQPYLSPRLKNFDIMRESQKLSSYPYRKSPETSILKNHRSSTSIERINIFDSADRSEEYNKKINVFKDLTSPGFYPWHRNSAYELNDKNKEFLTTTRDGYSGCFSNGGKIVSKDRTLYTMRGNKTFRENFKILNKVESLLTDDDNEPLYERFIKKKPIEKENFGFITEKIEPEDQDDGSNIGILKPGNDYHIFFKKFGFQYFMIGIKNKESPVKMMISPENGEKLIRFKIYLSRKSKTPNKFNAEFEYESKSFQYIDPEKRSFFKDNYLYFALYSEENIGVIMKISFGTEKRLSPSKTDEKYYKKRQFIEIPPEMLKSQIKEILMRRRLKRLNLSRGIDKVQENKKIPLPEAQIKVLIEKKERSAQRLVIAQIRSVEHFRQTIERKTEDLQRHERLLYYKALDSHIQSNMVIFLQFSRFWKTSILLIKLSIYLNYLNKEKRKDRIKKAYEKQLRNLAILNGLKVIRRRGETPTTRLLFEAKMMINYHEGFRRKGLNSKMNKMVFEVISQASIMFLLSSKLEHYAMNVRKIQKKWKLLKTRKMIYKATIRNIWNKNTMNFYYVLKKEKQGKQKELAVSSGLNEGLLFNSMLIGNIRSRKNEAATITIDMELQNQIIDKFMFENLKRYRDKMDKYRTSLTILNSDQLKKLQVDILKKFFTKKGEGNKKHNEFLEENFEIDNESPRTSLLEDVMIIKPPILYVRPKVEDIKEMFRNYLEIKKML